MSDHERQWRLLNEMRFRYGLSEPWEFKVREIAEQAIEHPSTYTMGGTLFPVRVGGERRYQEVRVSLAADLQAYPRLALLIAEQQVRDQTGEMLVDLRARKAA